MWPHDAKARWVCQPYTSHSEAWYRAADEYYDGLARDEALLEAIGVIALLAATLLALGLMLRCTRN